MDMQEEKLALKKREDIISHMVIKQEKKEDENKISIFQMADSLHSMDKNIKQRLSKLEKMIAKEKDHDKHAHIDDAMGFMKKHFSHKEKI